MNIVKTLFRILTTFYTKIQLLVILAMIVFAFFISESNVFAQIGYDKKINELNDQIEYYRNQTIQDKESLQQLESDKDHIEKFAREKYLMKKDNEDVFIVE